ncbi:M1 family metallopeptidase [Tsuneonella sp. HG222]
MKQALLLAAGVALLLPCSALGAQDQAPLATRTAQSGMALSPSQQAMDLPHLALAIAVDPASRTISGRADYTVRASAPLESVEFDLDPRLRISQVLVDGAALPRNGWSDGGGLLAIPLGRRLAVGEEARVAIVYGGTPFVAPNPPWVGGFMWDKTGDGRPWIATAVQGEGCDLLWPCIDHSAKRVALLDFAITVPKGLVAAANGRLLETDEGPDTTTFRWRAREPNSYAVSLQIAPYEVVEADYASRFGPTIPIRFWHLPGNGDGARRLVGELRDYLDFFESRIGPYPFADEKVGVAETPHLGMEHQTINAYGAEYKPAPEGYDWLLHHEFSHEWFANQLTMAATADMWLHEGLGTYMQALYLEWRGGALPFHDKMWELRKAVLSRVPLAPRGFVPSGYYNDRQIGWGDDIYYKGAWVAHTLRGLIGDEAFFATLTRTVYGRADPAPGNFAVQVADTDDFIRIAEDVSGRKLDWFAEAYFRVADLPRLDTRREGTRLMLSWQTPAALPFEMPLEVAVDGEIVTVPMSGGRGELPLPAPGAHVVIDPAAKILRHDPAVEAWRRSISPPAPAPAS